MPQPGRFAASMLIWDALNALPSRRDEVRDVLTRHGMPCLLAKKNEFCVATVVETIADGAHLCRADAAAVVHDLNLLLRGEQ